MVVKLVYKSLIIAQKYEDATPFALNYQDHRNDHGVWLEPCALVFKIVYDHQVSLWKKDFLHQAQKTIINLKSELKNGERILLDIISFYEASPNVTRKAFKSYISPILKRNNFIQALEWAPRVSIENRK